MTDASLPDLAAKAAGLVRVMIEEIRPSLVEAAISGQRGESVNVRHVDNFLTIHDIRMHKRYRELLVDVLPSFVYASEEGDPEVIGDPDPDLCVLVDPLDTSELAVRALHGYTHLMIYSRSKGRPIVSVVGDIFHHVQLYIASLDDLGQDTAYVMTNDSRLRTIGPLAHRRLADSLVTNYSMRPSDRFVPLAQQTELIARLAETSTDGKSRGRLGVDFGSVGLCHVAAGFTDAMVEFAKGFAAWDLYPGHHILHAAGGTVIDLNGQPISLNYGLHSMDDIGRAMNTRQKFIAASSSELAADILSSLSL